MDFDLDTLSGLIPQSKLGDLAARDQLMAQMQEFLEFIANRHMDVSLKQKIGTSDIVQGSFLRVVEKFDQFRGSTSLEFRAWVKQVVINEIHQNRRAFRSKKRDYTRENSLHRLTGGCDESGRALANRELTDDHLTPSSQSMAAERIDKFHEILEQLPEDYRRVIHLRNISQLSFRAIGQSMNRSEDAVSKLWCRAMVKFEDRLRESDSFNSNAANQG